MKSLFYLSLVAAGMFAVHAHGQSLYTLAGPVGLEESLPLKWFFNLAGGYDDNVNASNYNKQESAFISTDIGCSLANYDAVTQYSFSAKLGGIFYLKDLDGGTNEALSNYVGMNFTNRYKWTERLAVSLGWTGSYCNREYGNNEFSNFVMAGAEYAVSENTSATLRVGPQFKYVENYGTKTYPSAEFGLNHRLSDRFMLGTFVRYSNEAVNTYIPYNGASYYSNETWRFGVHSTLKLTHRVSLNCGVNLVASDYTRPSSISNSDTSNLTFNATAGIKLLLTNALALTAQYSYTNGSYSGYNYPMPSYNRNVFSFGMNYSF